MASQPDQPGLRLDVNPVGQRKVGPSKGDGQREDANRWGS